MRRLPYFVLFAGLAAASTAATIIRLSLDEGMPALVLAAGRLFVATVVLSPLVLAEHRDAFGKLGRRDWLAILACGSILGLHFSAWIRSFEYTSVMASVVFVSTSPLFVNLLSFRMLGERVSRPVAIATVVVVLGGILVSLPGEVQGPAKPVPLLGNALALSAAAAFALYLIIARRLRERIHFVPYIWLVYGTAAVAVALVALLNGDRFTGHTAPAYFWLLVLGLVPQLIGHSSFNFAVRYLPAFYVGLVSRMEAVFSTLLSAIVLGEWPRPIAVLGAVIILLGVGFASWVSSGKVAGDDDPADSVTAR